MAETPLQFWFEFASPYTYIAAERIEKLAASTSITVAWEPFLLGPVLQALGSKPPAEAQPWKVPYMWRDIERLCGKYNLPVRAPSKHPRFALLAARTALVALREDWGADFIRRIFRANFAEDRDIADKQVITDILLSMNQSPESILDRATSDTVKLQLREQTETAEQRGIFGSPTFIIQDEIFWGQDRLEDALAWAADAA
ncbi:MAG: 2-hydroxychromene-2-carboxylate isomerase [Mariprofundaceae bacterium]